MGKRSREKERRRNLQSPPAATPQAATAAVSEPAAFDRFTVGTVVFLLAGVLLLYAQVFSHQFLNYDDNLHVSQNPVVLKGLTLEGVRWAFTTFTNQNWHPVTWLSHMLDVQIWGDRAGGHALTNVFIHALNAVLLFLVLRKMTGAKVPSAIVAALFAVHPLRVESVAWVAERKDVLSSFFWLLTIWFYADWVRKKTPRRAALVAGAFLLGLLSKPMVVTLPFALLLLDWWPLQRISVSGERFVSDAWPLIREKIPLFILSATFSAVTVAAQQSAISGLQAIPFTIRFANAAISYVVYVGQTLWPAHLSVLYPYNDVSRPLAVVSLILLLAATAAVLYFRKKAPWLLTGWFWYLGTLVPVIGIVQVGAQSHADRYTYVPGIGLLIAAVWGISVMVASRERWRAAAFTASAAAVVALAAITWVQIGYWRDSVTLFRHAIAVTKDNEIAHVNLGWALSDAGDPQAGERELREALRINPANHYALAGLGLMQISDGRPLAALPPLQEAVRMQPQIARYHFALGMALITNGRKAEAAAELRKALELGQTNPNEEGSLPKYRAQLATAEERNQDAIQEFREAVRLQPGSADLHNDFAAAMARQGMLNEAVAEYQAALAIAPRMYDAELNLGAVLSRMGQDDAAIRHFARAAELRPESVEPRIYLALAYHNVRRFADAAAKVREAMAVDPEASNRFFTGATRLPYADDNLARFLAFLQKK